jgi:hypothetical protein
MLPPIHGARLLDRFEAVAVLERPPSIRMLEAPKGGPVVASLKHGLTGCTLTPSPTSKSPIAALTFPLAPTAIVRVIRMGAPTAGEEGRESLVCGRPEAAGKNCGFRVADCGFWEIQQTRHTPRGVCEAAAARFERELAGVPRSSAPVQNKSRSCSAAGRSIAP